ncbi:MAG: GNAT family N-acetyltransferase [Xanthobacteraceae bacterium]
MASRVYAFKAMTADDLPMLCGWLARPHVASWWGDPGEQFALVSGDLGHPAMNQFIVTVDGRAFAYLQCYDPAAWPEGGLGPQPAGTRGIDQFIGDPAMIEQGHGSAFIRVFVDDLFNNGAPRAVTDPDPDNVRAIRAYEKAGFQKQRLVDTCDGPALLMVRDA